MKAINKRILRLEDRLSPGELPYLVVVCKAGSEGVLDTDRCIEILRENGFLSTGSGFAVVRLLDVPDHLGAEELKMFLRENGARTRGLQPSS
jgi:hypothetical protein